jgi:transposase
MTRRYGHSPRGRRLVMPVPRGHRMTATFIAGLRVDGLVAPTVVDGAINGELFEAYVRQQLVPTLRPGDVEVMDDLACPKRQGGRRAIEGAGARLLLLPPYSSDLNPIDMAFAKLKALLRKVGERTVDGLWRLLGRPLDEFTTPGVPQLHDPLWLLRYINLRNALATESLISMHHPQAWASCWQGRCAHSIHPACCSLRGVDRCSALWRNNASPVDSRSWPRSATTPVVGWATAESPAADSGTGRDSITSVLSRSSREVADGAGSRLEAAMSRSWTIRPLE